MTTYTSGKHHKDPAPWRDSTRFIDYRASHRRDDDDVYEPRPEYDNHNPILAAFRADALTAREFLSQMDQDDMRDEATPEQLDHARRVLTKLAALTKED